MVVIPLYRSQAFFCTTDRLWLSHRPPENFGGRLRGRNHHHYHQESKQAGRKAALESPLYYPSGSQKGVEKGTDTCEGHDKGPIPGTDGFCSSFNYREKGGTRVPYNMGSRKSFRDSVQKASLQILPTSFSVMPDSFLAYRTLLRKGCVTHIMELVISPYAPGPLCVVHEVLDEILTIKEELQCSLQPSFTNALKISGIRSDDAARKVECEGRSEFDKNLESSNKTVSASDNDALIHALPFTCLDTSNGEKENVFLQDEFLERISSLERLETTMSRSVDLREVLQKVELSVQEVVKGNDTIGDRSSDLDLQTTIHEVERFASHILENNGQDVEVMPFMTSEAKNCVESPDSSKALTQGFLLNGGTQKCGYTSLKIASLLAWRLPANVYAELLHGILRLSHHLGTHLLAVRALEKLIELTTRVAFHEERKKLVDGDNTNKATHDEGPFGRTKGLAPCRTPNDATNLPGRDEFRIDDVVSVVDAELQAEFVGVMAQDHICTIASCQRVKDFETACSLYRRLLQHALEWKDNIRDPSPTSSPGPGFLLTTDELAQAFTALAHCAHNTSHFEELRSILTEDEASRAIPVSVPLYTALIYAVSRATEIPDRMAIALAFYRRLRDGILVPSVDTYAALMACCASTREPTHAFAFYHEARQIYGVEHFSPKLYTNLLLAYSNFGFGADARRTLDVLVEAGAPLTSSAFHAVLSGALTLREAEEVVEMMVNQYHISPTPHTYAFLLHAAMRHPAGVQTALKLFDLHEEATVSLLRLTPEDTSQLPSSASPTAPLSEKVAVSSKPEAATLEERLLRDYPLYVRSLENALMGLRIDPYQDPRLRRYLKPLMRVAQQRMNALTEMAPQAPTFIPVGACPCVAVLAPDVLAEIDKLVMPFISYYSVIVILYSALVALQMGRGRRVDGTMPKGYTGRLEGLSWQSAMTEHDAMVEYRWKCLKKFLKDYQEVIHLVSLEEELLWSRDARRYGIFNTKDLHAKSAAFALNLSRRDIPHSMKLYADNEKLSVILVSTNYTRCGRYVVDLKRSYLSKKSSVSHGPVFEGLSAGLRKVFFHNPHTQPNWTPPTLSIKTTTMKKDAMGADDGVEGKKNYVTPKLEKDRMAGLDTTSADFASHLYRKHLRQCENASVLVDVDDKENFKPNTHHTNDNIVDEKTVNTAESRNSDKIHIVAETNQTDEAIDAEILMAMMNL
ncbi:unnamed protein product [Phytomonas sp. Hart1]|nr:unnamed protein product [Phytomonas sp. Hart1]|eukprot:CCW69147.1 unnamed protein product [Phytomonas sp. isolate Hart1]